MINLAKIDDNDAVEFDNQLDYLPIGRVHEFLSELRDQSLTTDTPINNMRELILRAKSLLGVQTNVRSSNMCTNYTKVCVHLSDMTDSDYAKALSALRLRQE